MENFGPVFSAITRLGRGANITTHRGRGKGVTSQDRDADNASTTVRTRGTSKGATPGRARGVNKGVTSSQACDSGVAIHRSVGINVATLRGPVANESATNDYGAVSTFATSFGNPRGKSAADATPVLRE